MESMSVEYLMVKINLHRLQNAVFTVAKISAMMSDLLFSYMTFAYLFDKPLSNSKYKELYHTFFLHNFITICKILDLTSWITF